MAERRGIKVTSITGDQSRQRLPASHRTRSCACGEGIAAASREPR